MDGHTQGHIYLSQYSPPEEFEEFLCQFCASSITDEYEAQFPQWVLRLDKKINARKIFKKLTERLVLVRHFFPHSDERAQDWESSSTRDSWRCVAKQSSLSDQWIWYFRKNSIIYRSPLCACICTMAFQFTENVAATRDAPCERLSCPTIIQPGEPRIAETDFTGHTKLVCAPCSKYYKDKREQSLGNFAHTSMFRAGVPGGLILFFLLIQIFLCRRSRLCDAFSWFPDHAPECQWVPTKMYWVF